MGRRKKLRRALLLLLLLALLVGGVWWDDHRLVTDEFLFVSDRLPDAFNGFRIVQLSDLHGRQFGAGNARLIAAVAAARPDLIALTGDFVDAESDVSDIVLLIDGLLEIAPVYYVTGNHEWGSGQALTVVRTLRSMGVYCLENEFTNVERGGERILVAGVHDPNGFADQKTPEQLASEVYACEDDPFWLLLAHRNNLFAARYSKLGADLTLSGHAHGGIWRLPGTDGLVSTEKQLLPSYTSGFYECDGPRGTATLFVSRGLGNSPHWTVRLFNPPQVAVIILKKA